MSLKIKGNLQLHYPNRYMCKFRTWNYLSPAVLLAALLTLAACDKPSQPGPIPTPDPTPEPTPTAPYFRADLPAEFVFNVDAGVMTWPVETNITGWTATPSETWCKAVPSNTGLRLETESYIVKDDRGNVEYVAPRLCTVTVRAGTAYSKTIQVIQQTYTMISFPQQSLSANYDWIEDGPSGMTVFLSADGQTRDLQVSSNAWRWIPETDAAWLKVECVNNSTLRLTSTARAETETSERSATVKLYVESDALKYVTFQVQDAPATVGGDDFDYGDQTDWD